MTADLKCAGCGGDFADDAPPIAYCGACVPYGNPPWPAADAPEGPQKGTTLQYDAKNRLSYVWLIWVLHEQTGRWELQGICTSEAELTPRVSAIKNDPNTIQVRTEVAFVDHLFAAGETVGDYANRLHAKEG